MFSFFFPPSFLSYWKRGRLPCSRAASVLRVEIGASNRLKRGKKARTSAHPRAPPIFREPIQLLCEMCWNKRQTYMKKETSKSKRHSRRSRQVRNCTLISSQKITRDEAVISGDVLRQIYCSYVDSHNVACSSQGTALAKRTAAERATCYV